MTISAENQNNDKVDKETTAEDLTKGMDVSNNNAPQGGKEEVSGEVTETNANRHIFDMRIEFSTTAHSAVDTFSIVPAIKGLSKQLLATNVVHILARSNKKFFISMDDFPKTAEDFDDFFETDQQNYAKISKVWVRIKVTSTLPFWQLKKHGMLHGYLREHRIYINQHHFETLPITDIGVMLFKSPEFTFRQDYTKMLRRHILTYFSAMSDSEIKTAANGINELDLENNTLPLFEVTAKKQVKFQFKTTDDQGQQTTETESTIGLKILCETKERQRLSFLLTEATRHSKFSSGLFLGYSEKNQNPVQYRKALRANNIFLNSTIKIPVNNLHPILLDAQRVNGNFQPTITDTKEIPTVRESILSLSGTQQDDPTTPLFYAIESTPFTNEKGEYNLLTSKSHEKEANEFIDGLLHTWCTETREHTTHGDKFPKGVQRRTKRQYNQQALSDAIDTTWDSAPSDERLRAQAMAPPARMRYQRRQLNIWKDPAAFQSTNTPVSPWLGNKNWSEQNTKKNPYNQQQKHTKKTPTETTTKEQPMPEATTKAIEELQKNLTQLRSQLDTATAQNENTDSHIEKMRQQITAEVKASFPETTSTTFATQLSHMIEKSVVTRTQKLQKEVEKTNTKIQDQATKSDEFTTNVETKINNLALKTATMAEKHRTITNRLTDFEANSNKRFNTL
jgi:chaperonin cofactor prefoldin